jgi:hypothetical protein
MDKFIVLAARRSGITFLLSLLNDHPQVQCYKGIFTTKNRFKYLELDYPGSQFYKFRVASMKRRIDYFVRRKQLIGTFLTELYRPVDGVRAVGVRLSYIQARKYPEILEWAQENDVGVIHLIRKNSLKAIVSHFCACKRGVHHSTSEVGRVTVRILPLRLKRRLQRLSREIEKYRAVLVDGHHLELYYESLTADQGAEMQRVLDFLGVDQSVSLTSDLVKLNPDSLADILENFEQIARAFKGTPFEEYLTM